MIEIDTSDLVLEVQRRREAGANCAEHEAELVARVLPTLRKVAMRFSESARGSLSVEDLIQVGVIEALKLIPRYRFGAFEQVVRFRAMRACVDQIRLHSQDVHESAGAQVPSRRMRLKTTPAPMVAVVDAVEAEMGEAGEDPETLLSAHQEAARMRRCVNNLPLPYRDIVAWVHEIGRPKKTLRTLAVERNEPFSRVQALLKEGEARLRALLELEGC